MRNAAATVWTYSSAQPRSAGPLTYLLLARPRHFVPRDLLCGLFWPDADGGGHTRGALGGR